MTTDTRTTSEFLQAFFILLAQVRTLGLCFQMGIFRFQNLQPRGPDVFIKGSGALRLVDGSVRMDPGFKSTSRQSSKTEDDDDHEGEVDQEGIAPKPTRRCARAQQIDGSNSFSMTKLITGRVVTALLCSSLSGCSRGDIMEAIAVGSAIAGAATVITIVAVHEATERQRQVAQEQGHLAYQQLIEQHKTRGVKESRYIAAATVREPDSKGAKSLMIFDTETDQVVGNHVYDVKTEPKTGQVVKFESYSAEYVGTGQY